MRDDRLVTVDGVTAAPYTCVHCGLKSVALVRGRTVEQWPGLERFVEAFTQSEPRELRHDDAAIAERLGPLAPCPKCNKVDEARRARHTRVLRVRAALAGLVGAFIGSTLPLGRYGAPAVWGLLLAVVAAVWTVLATRWQADVEARVKVLPGAEAQPLLQAWSKRTPPPKEKGEQEWLWPLGIIGLCLVLSAKFVGQSPFGLQHDTTAQVVHFSVALGAAVVIGWGLWLQWNGKPQFRQRLRDRVLIALGLCGFYGYFNFGHLHFGNFVHVWDTYHYVIGAKYFPELGYELMYDCATVANAENGHGDEVARQTITDLRTNIIVKTDEIMEHPERCTANFSPERWAAYRKDIAQFRSFVNEGRWREIHLDHGYNATPVWTLAGFALTNGAPVTMDQLKQLNLIDPIYLALTLVMIWWAFGPRAFAVAAIVLGTHFPNRFYWTGGAFLRHDWVFFFVASIALLRKERPYLAGAAFAYTVLLRLFPGLAAAGVAVAAFEYVRRHKKLDPTFVKYVVSGVLTTVLLVGASFVAFGGPTTWQRFAQNTVKHANTPLTNHMGLRTVLSWRPDSIGQKTVRPGLIDSWYLWKSTRLANWKQLQWVMWLVFALGMGLVWLALTKTTGGLWVAAAMGTGFIVIGAELTNYYYCFLMGLAVLHEKKREVGLILTALAALSQYLNWGPIRWMSHWLDEQYMTMSLAALFAVFGVWWLFTPPAEDAVAPPEVVPEPLELPSLAPAAPAKK